MNPNSIPVHIKICIRKHVNLSISVCGFSDFNEIFYESWSNRREKNGFAPFEIVQEPKLSPFWIVCKMKSTFSQPELIKCKLMLCSQNFVDSYSNCGCRVDNTPSAVKHKIFISKTRKYCHLSERRQRGVWERCSVTSQNYKQYSK